MQMPTARAMQRPQATRVVRRERVQSAGRQAKGMVGKPVMRAVRGAALTTVRPLAAKVETKMRRAQPRRRRGRGRTHRQRLLVGSSGWMTPDASETCPPPPLPCSLSLPPRFLALPPGSLPHSPLLCIPPITAPACTCYMALTSNSMLEFGREGLSPHYARTCLHHSACPMPF